MTDTGRIGSEIKAFNKVLLPRLNCPITARWNLLSIRRFFKADSFLASCSKSRPKPETRLMPLFSRENSQSFDNSKLRLPLMW